MPIVVFLLLLLAQGQVAAEPLGKRIFGLEESVALEQLGLTVAAKLDTGADSSSLDARAIRQFSEAGQDWVSFDIADGEGWRTVTLPLADQVRIRRRSESLQSGQRGYSRRPVVTLDLCLGDRQVPARVNLTDRSNFQYPLLLGVDVLRELAVLVDPSASQTAGLPRCPAIAGEVFIDNHYSEAP